MGYGYLFVHFKEKETPEGEQVYFALSRDGYNWEPVNEGNPVLYSVVGEQGVRDMAIVRRKEPDFVRGCEAGETTKSATEPSRQIESAFLEEEKGGFVILATDLSLSRNLRGKYASSWERIRRGGSPFLVKWESQDLVNWTSPSLLRMPSPGGESFGCVWAPDITLDRERGDYLVHWSSCLREDDSPFKIYYARTRDFTSFEEAGVLYEAKEGDVIDSALLYDKGRYYLFVKQEGPGGRIHLLSSESILGPYERVEGFYESMEAVERGVYEGTTAIRLPGGECALFLDYYGRPGKAQGYRMMTGELSTGVFSWTEKASFPYGFKHGTVLEICEEEYKRVKGMKRLSLIEG